MLELNKIYKGTAHDMIKLMQATNTKVNLVLTSPPYNTGRTAKLTQKARDLHEVRYDMHIDNMSDDEYIDWTIDLFTGLDSVLTDTGVVLYNMSYSTDITNMNETYNPHEIMWRTVANIIERTPFTTVDCIVWKKSSALPNNMSPNKLTRIVEFIYVFCKKTHIKDFHANKRIKSYRANGQANYENVFNFIEAKNNDGVTKLNKATYSSELCDKLLDIYGTNEQSAQYIVFDPFMGTGTTAVSCVRQGISYLGSEISEAQIVYANNRIDIEQQKKCIKC